MNLRDMPSLLTDERADQETASSRKRGGRGRIATARDSLNRLARSKAGVSAGLVLCVAVVAFALARVGGVVADDQPQWPRIRVMDKQTGDLRWKRVAPQAEFPYRNPKTGERSMYPVEYCFYNECGPAGGTPVILNDYLGKEGPTTCPRCGEEVHAHNPRPSEYVGVKPDDWK